MLAFFRRRLRDPCEAEDATQDVFARLGRQASLDRIDNIEGYLFQAAANQLRERARRASGRPGSGGRGLRRCYRPPCGRDYARAAARKTDCVVEAERVARAPQAALT
jgi:DNA-directed RNA polymerase specialized sigma24 family protein